MGCLIVEQARLGVGFLGSRHLFGPILCSLLIRDNLLLTADKVGTFLLLIASLFFPPFCCLHLFEKPIDE